jgi:hypothetical protein
MEILDGIDAPENYKEVVKKFVILDRMLGHPQGQVSGYRMLKTDADVVKASGNDLGKEQ